MDGETGHDVRVRRGAVGDVGGGAACSVVALLAIRNIGGPVLPSAWYIPVNLLMTAVLVVIARRAGVTWRQLGFARHRRLAGLRTGVVVGAVAAAVMAVGALLQPTQAFFDDERVDVAAGGGELAYQTLLRIPLGTVLFEEVAFRGVLLALLRCRISTRAAVVFDSGLFGLWHVVPTLAAARTNDVVGLAQTGAVAAAVLVTAAGGVLFCALRLRSGHLLAPMLLHLAFNDSGYLLSWWVRS